MGFKNIYFTKFLWASVRGLALPGQSCSLEMQCVVLTPQLLPGPVMGQLKLERAMVPGLCKAGYILQYKHMHLGLKSQVAGRAEAAGGSLLSTWREAVSPWNSFQEGVWEPYCSQLHPVTAQGCREDSVGGICSMGGNRSLASSIHPFSHTPYSSPTASQTPLFSDQHGTHNPCPHREAIWLSLVASLGRQVLWLRLSIVSQLVDCLFLVLSLSCM